jgi:hypothetical protein
MENQNLNYPVMIFKKGHKQIYSLNKNFGIISKGGASFYKDLTIIDSMGNVYTLGDVKIKGRASILTCFLHFQIMLELSVSLNNEGVISLEALKEKIITKIKENSKFWLVLDTVEGIEKMITEKDNYEDLIRIFR